MNEHWHLVAHHKSGRPMSRGVCYTLAHAEFCREMFSKPMFQQYGFCEMRIEVCSDIICIADDIVDRAEEEADYEATAHMTDEELEETAKRSEAAFLKWMTDLAENRCPDCQQTIVSKRQVGPCVYARPCGHRLYQGRV